MPSISTTVYYALVVAWGASFYQLTLKDIFATTYGFGRVIQNIDEFPYSCRRIEHERLEGCEDLWLDNEARVLYAACAGTESRLAWTPANNNLNASGRRLRGSDLIALDIDKPGNDGLFGMRAIGTVGYVGALGDDALDLHGLDGEVVDEDTIHFYLVNHRPPVDANRKLLDAEEIGANSTIEVFELKRGYATMRHLRTVASPEIRTPNRVAAVGGGAFVLTNDQSVKVGQRRMFDGMIGGGNVAYCSASGVCHSAYEGNEEDGEASKVRAGSRRTSHALIESASKYLPKAKLKFPNGLTRGKDGLIYVPSSIDGKVRVFGVRDDKTLKLLDTISVGMPIDNISPDANGDIYVAGFPRLRDIFKSFPNPREIGAAVSILRIKKVDASSADRVRYTVEKVIEDEKAEVLSGVTVATHDAKTGRLFAGAVVSPYLVVCEPK
ncbi:serum paraoxonase/arylesteras-like protein [Dothidotthia symphoricarpi CBS 119687]|uniref:Serum paraoxonase/arylesteras-like protein n=1 Tax=Dothidotthia symphoricarpi CBS 119687 TaxID=1392245 RepID=A0A6A6A6H5_9PLEO|nr:serum paraoxonase/arylesteras-like protein [Dothidotthia symphoricarpi CBS 119687]KAF2127489.1 serum paraoxonase/arylesteras-like protein [Dothidotthia symphoricarpi CBS 119687]